MLTLSGDRANDQVAEVTASNMAFATSAEVLANQVATLTTENADVRRMNDVLSAQVTEVKQDRDMLKGQADKVPGLFVEAAVLKEQRDARANEACKLPDNVEGHSGGAGAQDAPTPGRPC